VCVLIYDLYGYAWHGGIRRIDYVTVDSAGILAKTRDTHNSQSRGKLRYSRQYQMQWHTWCIPFSSRRLRRVDPKHFLWKRPRDSGETTFSPSSVFSHADEY
jgi:hypothetical protein